MVGWWKCPKQYCRGKGNAEIQEHMARASNLTMCSFCGKSHAEVRKLIAGPGVYICDSCINVCKSILDKELNEDARRQSSNIRVPKPAEIRRSSRSICDRAGHRQEDTFCGGAQSLQARAANSRARGHVSCVSGGSAGGR